MSILKKKKMLGHFLDFRPSLLNLFKSATIIMQRETLAQIEFEKLAPETKVRSLLSYAVGEIIEQDFEHQELSIRWTRDNETNTVRVKAAKLTSVILAR